jgi:serine/threonine protein kinase
MTCSRTPGNSRPGRQAAHHAVSLARESLLSAEEEEQQQQSALRVLTEDPCDDDLVVRAGDTLHDGAYTALESLGSGAFGHVYRCQDNRRGGSPVAVKVLKSSHEA